MTKSMTAYGRAALDFSAGTLCWEIRAVNHRYLELSIRAADEFRHLEPDYRSLIHARVQRGKIEATLHFKPAKLSGEIPSLNASLVVTIVNQTQALQRQHPSLNPMRVTELMQWPGVMLDPTTDQSEFATISNACLDNALDDFIANREREGLAMAEAIDKRRAQIVTLAAEIAKQRPKVIALQREKLMTRLEQLPTLADPGRIEQELVIAAGKLDIDEELDRLNAHCIELGKALNRKDAIGRRLDFLMQEFNREANTLSSKSHDHRTTELALEIKVLIEQMREQVQNIE